MSTKPGAFVLSRDAANFTFSNLRLLLNHAKVVFPLLIICLAVEQAGKVYKFGGSWLWFVLTFGTLFIYACFILAWHRSSLQGPDTAHERNPFTLKREDWKFVGLFCGVSAVLGFLLNLIGFSMQYVLPAYGDMVVKAGGIAAVVVMIFVLLLFLRVSFLFPAKSVGVALNWADSGRASKGLVWPLLGANLIFCLIFIVAFSVYMVVVTMVAESGAGDATISPVTAVIIGSVIETPVVFAGLVYVALSVTALSRAYQWGIQNNQAA